MYAEAGLKIFPVQPNSKEPFKGSNGHLDATSDTETIRRWFEQQPEANIGLSLAASGYVAIDIDSYKANCVWDEYCKDKLLPDTRIHKSPRGGHHYIFQSQPGAAYPGQLCEGVDVKHDGYIVLPPSSAEGGQYTCVAARAIAPAPVWLARTAPPSGAGATGTKARLPGTYSACLAATQRWLATAPNAIADRHTWVRLAMALKHCFGDDTREAFIVYSERWDGHSKVGEAARVYDTARPEGSVTFGTVTELLSNAPPHEPDPNIKQFMEAVQMGVTIDFEAYSRLKQGQQSAGFANGTSYAPPREVKEREWLIKDWVPMNTVTMLGGDGGTGKSLLALQQAIAVASGSMWMDLPVRQGTAIYLSAEDDDDELHRRMDSILLGQCLTYEHLGSLWVRSMVGMDTLLAVEGPDGLLPSALYDELNSFMAFENPTVLYLDTLANFFPSNENDRAKVRQFVSLLLRIAQRHQCAVVLLAHPSLTGMSSGSGLSGSTAWHNSVRSRLYLDRVRNEDGEELNTSRRVLRRVKANYGSVGEEIDMLWEAGQFTVPDDDNPAADLMAALPKVLSKAEGVFLKLLDRYTEEGRYVSAQPGPTYAPSTFASHPDAEGCTKRAFKTAMDSLFGRDELRIAQHGKGAKTRSHLARKAEGTS